MYDYKIKSNIKNNRSSIKKILKIKVIIVHSKNSKNTNFKNCLNYSYNYLIDVSLEIVYVSITRHNYYNITTTLDMEWKNIVFLFIIVTYKLLIAVYNKHYKSSLLLIIYLQF